MKRLSAVLFIIGSAVVLSLLAWQGLAPVTALLGAAGWTLMILGAYFAVPLVLAALSWRVLLPPAYTPSFPRALLATWLGLGVNWLLPVAQIGGEVVRARCLAQRSTPGTAAAASVVIDKTLQAAAQVVYTLGGLGLLVALHGRHEITLAVVLGGAILGVAVLAFYKLQRGGLFGRLARLTAQLTKGERVSALAGGAVALDEEIGRGYRRHRRLAGAFLGRMANRFALAGEVWLALMLMGHPIGLAEAVILESLGQAVRAAAFAVPAGVGVQEVGLIAIGAALGLPLEVALALALAKRVRELVVGLPALLVLQQIEGRLLYRRTARH